MARAWRSRGAHSDFFPGFADVVEIGMGSLATVYRARELGTNRHVALKLLNVREASPRALESFQRESIALGAVSSHPNIVTLYRSFRAADGRPVLVLELCRGSVGVRTIEGHGMPAAEVVSLGVKIAGALETAHRAQILHRDVKPQNILITDFGEPALADFGVAMLQSSTHTTAGLFDFTTLHAAPELLEGGETSAATDVYELASTLYQLVAGKSAFRAYDGESPASVILRILRDPVQPLVNARVPAALSDLLIYAMSKDKNNRPPTAAEFAAELAAVEVVQDWPRTQFLIRDPPGTSVGLPSVTRLPLPTRRGRRPAKANGSDLRISDAPSHPPPLHPPPLQRPAERTDEFVGQAPQPDAAGIAPAQAPRAREAFDPPGATDPRAVPVDPSGPAPATDRPEYEGTRNGPAVAPQLEPGGGDPAEDMRRPGHGGAVQYPIPPQDSTHDPAGPPQSSAPVPNWSVRAPAVTPVPGAALPRIGDSRLDPALLGRRMTLRSRGSSLRVDDTGIVLRVRLRRTEIAWTDISGFAPRFAGPGASDGRLVALTAAGPLELPATRRPVGELRYLHALLDAYRQRAHPRR